MATTTQVLNTPAASSIDEARALIRQCAEPCKAGELIKEAIFRASRRLEMPLSRTRDIWYGDARRIDANEMDRLRRGAEEAELARALAALEFLNDRAVALDSNGAIKQLRAALLAFQRDYGRDIVQEDRDQRDLQQTPEGITPSDKDARSRMRVSALAPQHGRQCPRGN
jgi:hypothetical protein